MTANRLQNWLLPDWDAPANVVALTTTRSGGCSHGDYESFNLATHVGEEPACVEQNRLYLQHQLGFELGFQWLKQVHGVRVVKAKRDAEVRLADATFTTECNLACCVLTADCLPVFLAGKKGDVVAMVHAGWRGLVSGVLEKTVASLPSSGDELLAWLGPAIGPCHFQVGNDVRDAALNAAGIASPEELEACFKADSEPDKYRADLYRLATLRLQALGVEVSGGGLCTYCNSAQFYSFRRQRTTGRMASLIYLKA